MILCAGRRANRGCCGLLQESGSTAAGNPEAVALQRELIDLASAQLASAAAAAPVPVAKSSSQYIIGGEPRRRCHLGPIVLVEWCGAYEVVISIDVMLSSFPFVLFLHFPSQPLRTCDQKALTLRSRRHRSGRSLRFRVSCARPPTTAWIPFASTPT